MSKIKICGICGRLNIEVASVTEGTYRITEGCAFHGEQNTIKGREV